METKTRMEAIIAVIYLIIIFIIKNKVLDKKCDKNKSELIFNSLSFLLIPYFLALKQISLAAIVLIVIVWQYFISKRRKK